MSSYVCAPLKSLYLLPKLVNDDGDDDEDDGRDGVKIELAKGENVVIFVLLSSSSA